MPSAPFLAGLASIGGAGSADTAPRTDAAVLIDLFLAGHAERTRDAYRRDLESFAADFGFPGPAQAIELLLQEGAGAANTVAFAYRAHLMSRGLAPASVNRRLATLRSLFLLAQRLALVAWRLEVASVRARSYRNTHGPGDQGVRQLLQAAAAQPDPRKSRRDVALLRLLHDVALRRGEVCRLDLADVDLERGRLAVIGKGDVERTTIALPDPTQRAIGGWLEVRGRDPGPLFLGLDGTGRLRSGARLSGAGLWSIVRALGRRAGLVAWPHGLRHTAITCALERTNGDLRKVQRFSRHRDVGAVLAYDDNRSDLGGAIAAMVATSLDDPSHPDRGT